ncbi:BfmA/BtgA family mobilization protein [Pedobacter frigidisoli]|uniref:BfmA/BtgA family mobilization protein n=1 Tax=Pedobacter frigidisoli TaxID=2530455 RepID=UPI00292DA5CD|nr:BfmA/BtgA family mobilization protein [Pedobacter frigidisoli]
MDMQETLRTVKYSVQDDVKFEKIALKLGRSKRLVFSQMLDYFYRSKKDPTDLNDELLKNTILKGQKEYIGFIKTQETELLIPIKRDSARMIEVMKKIIDSFNGQILKHNDEMLSNQSAQAKRLGTLHEVASNIEMKIITKERLKKNFMLILNSYIRERERMGMMTSGKEKEELAEQTRKQIELL